jgi:hypothetical protein
LSLPPRLSADGLFYWDGKQWASALSPDGRHRWDGSSWVAIALAPPSVLAPHAGFIAPPATPPAPRPSRTPTSSTRPLQYAVGGLAAATSAWYAALPFWVTGLMSDEIRRRALTAAAANPGLYPNPSQYADGVTTFAVILLDVVSIVYVAIAVVALIGAIRRWTWMYYAVLVLLAVLVLGLPAALASVVGISPAAPALGGSLLVVQWAGVVLGLISTALFAWMLVTLLRRGPWATRKLAAE